MESDRALRELLEDLTIVLASDNRKREVELIPEDSPNSSEFGYTRSVDKVFVNPRHSELLDVKIPEEEELSLIIDTTSHEIEHTVVSDLNAKEDFAEEHDLQNLAGFVINVVEDKYIDNRRLNRIKGLEHRNSKWVDFMMQGKDEISSRSGPGVYADSLLQISKAGYVKGINEADDDVKEFCGRIRPVIKSALESPTPEVRWLVAEKIMEIINEYIDVDIEDSAIPQEIRSGGEGENGSGGVTSSDEISSGDTPDDFDLDDLEPSDEEIEDEIEDMEEMDMEDDLDSSEISPDDCDDNSGEKNYEKYLEKKDRSGLELRRSERDRRIEKANSSVPSSNIEERFSRSLAQQIENVFRKIKSRSTPEPTSDVGNYINVRGYIRNQAGDTTEDKLFLHQDRSELGDRCVAVAIDGSGSMDEEEAKLALRALAAAVNYIGDRLAIIEYHENDAIGKTTSRTNLVTAPDERFERTHLDSFGVGGRTPTADGIRDARMLTEKMPNTEDVIVCITDGKANVTLSDSTKSTGDATKDAREQVRKARNENKRVIGMGVGDISEKSLRNVFGDNYIKTDMNNIAKKLLEIYESQMDTVDTDELAFH